MSSHSWESYEDPVHAWDSDGPDDAGGFWGEVSDDDFAEEPVTPGQQLVSRLLEHMLYSRLSSTQCCELMYGAKQAGVAEAKPYSLKPGSSTGHAARKLKAALGHNVSTDLYEAGVPGHSRHDLERTSHLVSFMPLHEQIARSMEQDVGTLTKLIALKASGDLPPIYTQHKVVTDHPDEPVLPIAIFMDAVPYSQTDSVLGCWGLNVLSGERFLFGVLRKRNACRCGCKGWCSYDVLFRIARWSLEALAKKAWPTSRHTGEPWLPSDSARADLVGQPFPVRCACLYIKGDWAEYAHTLGLHSWTDGIRPCFVCAGLGSDLFVGAINDAVSLRW